MLGSRLTNRYEQISVYLDIATNCGAYQIPLSLFRSGKDLVDPDSLPQQVKYNMVASSTDYAEKTKNQINPSWKKRSS